MKKPNFITRHAGLFLAILFGTAVVFVITQYGTEGSAPANEPAPESSITDADAAVDTAGNVEKDIMDYLKEYGYTEGRPAIIDMFATWCGPCMKMAPHIKSLAESYKESLQVIQVDIDANEGFARAIGIEAVPTLIIIDKDGNMSRHVGAMSGEELTSLAESLIQTR
ncbi:MAG: thioredoxin family protein [Prevotella sp.]